MTESEIHLTPREERPLVTFALFAYNQEKYIHEAIEGAFAQTYEPLEIIMSDDCSSDRTFEVMQEMAANYRGAHKVTINRNPKNIGISAHVNRVMGLAEGEIIVIAAGDDISLPNRAAKSVEALRENCSASMVSFTDIIIDGDSREIFQPHHDTNKNEYLIVTLDDYLSGKVPHVSGASRCFHRKVIDFFGELNKKCPVEDGPYLMRGLMLGDVLISQKAGIKYRQHQGTLSGYNSLHSMNFNEFKKQGQDDLSNAVSKGIVDDTTAEKIGCWIEDNFQRRTFFSGLYYSKSRLIFFLRKGIFNKHIRFREKLFLGKMLIDPRRPFVCDFL